MEYSSVGLCNYVLYLKKSRDGDKLHYYIN
jgi:hypothetical protein